MSVMVAASMMPAVGAPVFAGETEAIVNSKVTPGYIPEADPLVIRPAAEDGAINAHAVTDMSELPSSYGTNYLDAYNQSKVRNQSPFGSCWSFTGMTTLERRMEQDTDARFNFSEEHLLHKLSKFGGYGYTAQSKNAGGNTDMSSAYLVSNLGVMNEEDYPYLKSDLSSSYDSSANSDLRATDIEFFAPEYNEDFSLTAESIDKVKAAVMEYGSVYAYMCWDGAKLSNNNAYCITTPRSQSNINHAITVVGWDDNYSADNFQPDTANNDGAWIIQNSWGTEQCDSGYFYLSYEDTQFMPGAAVAGYERMGYHDRLYQHDPGAMIRTRTVSYINEVMYANVYDIASESELNSVTVFTGSYRQRMAAYIMPVDSKGIPKYNERQLVSGTAVTSSGGYHTISLNGTDIPKGKIAIGIGIHADNDDSRYAIGYEWNNSSYIPEKKAGQSFEIQMTNDKCTDVTSLGIANFSIKLKVTEKHKYTGEEITAPECSHPGEMKYTCSCGDSYTEDVPALPHEWDDGEIVKPSTCTEEGEKVYLCDNCDATRTEILPKVSHSYSENYTVDKAETASEDGEKSIHCNNCDDRIYITTIPASSGHNWDEGTVTTRPSCGNDGIMTYACQDAGCNETAQFTISRSDRHKFGKASITTEATCSQSGIESRECEVCGYVLEKDLGINPDNHNFIVQEYTEPTCQREGYRDQICADCQYEEKGTLPAVEHSFGDYVEDIEPFCEEEGSRSRHCKWYSECGATTDSEAIPALEHVWKKTGVKSTDCLENNRNIYVCAECTKMRYTVASTYGPHDYVTTIRKATFTAGGYEKKECSKCGDESLDDYARIGKCELSTDMFSYTGSNVRPAVTVRDSYGLTIPKTEYTVTYPSASKSLGTYKAVVTFQNHYSGTRTLTYKVTPVPTTLKSLKTGSRAIKVYWNKKTTQVAGYQIQYSKSSSFSSGNKTKKISGSSKTSAKITKLSKGKKYYVRIRTYKTVNGITRYSKWSAKKYIVVK